MAVVYITLTNLSIFPQKFPGENPEEIKNKELGGSNTNQSKHSGDWGSPDHPKSKK